MNCRQGHAASEANGKWISESGVYWKWVSFQRENAEYLPENILQNLFISLSRQWSRLTAAKKDFYCFARKLKFITIEGVFSPFSVFLCVFGDFSLNFAVMTTCTLKVSWKKKIRSKFNKLNTFSLFYGKINQTIDRQRFFCSFMFLCFLLCFFLSYSRFSVMFL